MVAANALNHMQANSACNVKWAGQERIARYFVCRMLLAAGMGVAKASAGAHVTMVGRGPRVQPANLMPSDKTAAVHVSML